MNSTGSMPGSMRQREQLDQADQAELDVLIDALLEAVLDHRSRCAICRSGGPWCEALRDCFEIVVGWRRQRLRRSRAEWLRRELDDAEYLRQVAHRRRMGAAA